MVAKPKFYLYLVVVKDEYSSAFRPIWGNFVGVPAAYSLRIDIFSRRSEWTSTIELPAGFLPILTNLNQNHLKSGCREGLSIMGRMCCAPGCRSGYDGPVVGVSLHTFPKDDKRVEAWKRAIPLEWKEN